MSALKLPDALVEVDEHVRQRVMLLAENICKQTGVSPMRMLGPSRTPSVVRARHALMAALWMSGDSVSEVGAILGMHHTSVAHGLRNAVGAEQYRAGILARCSSSRVRVSP